MPFQAFVGIDQTGAVKANGMPRALRAAMVLPEPGRLVLRDLPSASREVLQAWAREEGVEWKRLAIVIDAVIGLPAKAWPPWASGEGGERPWSLFRRAAETPGWGRGPGSAFFASILPDDETRPNASLPRRPCEHLAGANSVFCTRPFQKNVQTGTFRLWKDLASGGGARWANVWSFDARAAVDGPWLFEGYPSLLWWKVFGHRRRAPAKFREVVATAASLGVRAVVGRSLAAQASASADVADAAVLALGAACLDARDLLHRPFRGFERAVVTAGEGWIVGLSSDVSPS